MAAGRFTGGFVALDENINTLEKEKFAETLDGKTAVRVEFADGSTLSGTFSPSGLSIGGRVSVVEINNLTWTALPAVALENRNAMGIINRSGQNIVINYSNTVSGFVGVPVDNQAERFYDITDNIVVYAKSQLGVCDVIVEELA